MNPLLVELKANISEFSAKMDEAQAHIKKVGMEGEAAASHLAKASHAAMALAATAAAGVAFEVGKRLVEAFSEGQAANANFYQAVADTGRRAKDFTGVLEDTESSMRKLGYANADTAQGMAVLTQMTKSPIEAHRLMGLAADLSRARHMDLASAVEIVGKAATGHVAMLARYGLATKDAAGHTLSARAAIDALGKSVGGAAAAYSGTLSGQLSTFRAQVDNVKERLGAALVPALVDLEKRFSELGAWLKSNVLPILQELGKVYEHHKTLIKALAVGIAGAGGLLFALYEATKAVRAIKATWEALNLVLQANPWMRVVTVVLAVAAALVYAWNHSKTFRNTVIGVWHDVEQAVGQAVAAIINDYLLPMVKMYGWVAEKITAAMDDALSWTHLFGNRLHEARAAVHDFVVGTTVELQAFAANAQKWGTQAGNNLSDAVTKSAKKAHQDLVDQFTAPSVDYGQGLSNAVVGAHKAAHHSAHHAVAKHHANHMNDTIARLRAALQREKEAALQAAQAVYAARLKTLQLALTKSEEARRQAELAAAIAKRQSDVSLDNGVLANEGLSFQDFSRRAGTTVNLQLGGVYMSAAQLSSLVADQLRVEGRRNVTVGLA